MKNTVILTLILALAVCAGCGDNGSETTADTAQQVAQKAPAAPFNPLAGSVVETMDSGGYTYILLDNGQDKIWLAGPVTAVKVGEKVGCSGGMVMPDFHSKTLDRTFEKIYFVNSIAPAGSEPTGMSSGSGGGMGHMGGSAGTSPNTSTDEPISGTRTVLENAKVEGVSKASGGYTIEDIYAKSAELEGKDVTIRARVVKFSPNIMGTNWIHIQDGSGGDDNSDLTITTSAKASIGDLVLVKGKLTVDKDFGAGYKYHVIIEEASLTKE